MLHYQVVRTSPGGATLSNKMNNTVHYGHVRHTLALMCATNHLLTFSSFLDIWENVEWPRFLDHPVQCAAKKYPLKFFAIFLATARNFYMKFYTLIINS